MRDYQKEFEKLRNRVQGWTQKVLVGTFMGSLKLEIAEGIRMFKPKSLKEAISLARMRDDQLTCLRKITKPLQFNHNQLDLSCPTKATTAMPMKRLTWDEMQKKRALGLRFNCDDKFTTGHKCRRPQLLLLEGDHGSSNVDDEDPVANELISLHALTGWSTSRTMKITAKIGNHELTVLIDSGSTHKFISE